MERNKKLSRFQLAVIIILTIQFLATGTISAYLIVSHNQESVSSKLEYESENKGKCVLYIGTNDKDTYTELIPYDEAKSKVNAICSKYVEGFTVSEANGGWVDEKGKLTDEKTLVYTINDAEESDIIAIMDEVLKELNQNSIMVERQDLTYCYYNGKKR